MKNYPHPIIAREGWLYIFISIVITVFVFNVTNFWVSIPFVLITIFIIQFFRDPARVIPNGDKIILSPADGRVICVEQANDPYLNRSAFKISIFMNVFNVHSNRSPVSGEVIDLKYYPGKFLNASFDKASVDNERNAMVIRLKNQQDITVVQVAGLIARRILCYTTIGETLTIGQRYGFIKFGSRVDVYLPVSMTPQVSLGQKVWATETILATYN